MAWCVYCIDLWDFDSPAFDAIISYVMKFRMATKVLRDFGCLPIVLVVLLRTSSTVGSILIPLQHS